MKLPKSRVEIATEIAMIQIAAISIRDGKGTPKNFCGKDFAELSGASKSLFYWAVPSNCSENSLVLFVRCLAFGVLFFGS